MNRFLNCGCGGDPPGGSGGGGSGDPDWGWKADDFWRRLAELQERIDAGHPQAVWESLVGLHDVHPDRMDKIVQVAGTGHLDSLSPDHVFARSLLAILVHGLMMVRVHRLPPHAQLPLDRQLRLERAADYADRVFDDLNTLEPLQLMALYPDLMEHLRVTVKKMMEANIDVTMQELRLIRSML